MAENERRDRGGRGRRTRGRRSRHRPAEEYANRLGHRFRDLDLLERALTHGSWGYDRDVADYERLEFLGDAALGLVITEAMHRTRPGWTPHQRQETKSALVNNDSLAGAARALSLDRGIRSADDSVRQSDRILANVFEAVLGAAYLDGGLPAVNAIVASGLSRKLRHRRLDVAPPTEGVVRRAVFGPFRLLSGGARMARRVLRLGTAHERAMRHVFRDRTLLDAALAEANGDGGNGSRRHGGRGRYRNGWRNGRRGGRNGERDADALRFLGADVMQLIAADVLHHRFPDWDEGRMTLARMRLKEREFADRLSEAWGFSGERSRAAEAVLGALYLDGRLPAARRALRPLLREALEELGEPGLELLDPKTLLQNRLARDGHDLPTYELRRGSPGRDRSQVSVTLRLHDGSTEVGRGQRLKDAEKDAAAKAYARLYGPKRRRRGWRGGDAEEGTGRTRPRTEVRSDARTSERTEDPTPPTPREPGENPKGELQEVLVRSQGRLPVYRLVSETGPDHEKEFVVEVAAGRKSLGRGSGRSRRKAEAAAAAAALRAGV